MSDPPERWPWQPTDAEFFDYICRSLPQCEPWELVEMLIAAGGPDLSRFLPPQCEPRD
jgi:hypothetical protein